MRSNEETACVPGFPKGAVTMSQNEIVDRFNVGDWVQVKEWKEIERTLDADGILDGLPFMLEMVQYCGRRFRVLRWAEKVCFEAAPYDYVIRELRGDDVLFLEGLRCNGAEHDGCQRLCLFFWKLAWLRRADQNQPEQPTNFVGVQTLKAQLKTRTTPTQYFCQATEMARATLPNPMSKRRILLKCFRDIHTGAVSLQKMFWLIVVPIGRKIRDVLIGRPWLLGDLTKTPVGTLGLQPGELVEVLSLEEMRQTLDKKGRNRGLICDIELQESCGKQYRVLSRLDRFISDYTGQMRKIESTVMLEGVQCLCARVVGGCSRLDYGYYREVWLKRVEASKPTLIQIGSRV